MDRDEMLALAAKVEKAQIGLIAYEMGNSPFKLAQLDRKTLTEIEAALRSQAEKETCHDCGKREPCDDDCPNHPTWNSPPMNATYQDTVCKVAAAREGRLAELREALEKIAKQHLPEELEANFGADDSSFGPDYENGYEEIIKIARAVLLPREEGSAA